MRCNSCWKELEGRAVATVCGHIFCTDDAAKILACDSTCPLCEQMLSKSNMKSLDLHPNEDWTNMIMAGVPPDCIMKSAYKGVIFWIGQMDVESQVSINRAAQLKQKLKEMEQTYVQKMSEFQSAYSKAMKRIQALEAERDSLAKDKGELEEKYSEKSRQKRKLEEMYESLRGEYEKAKRVAGVTPNPRTPAAFHSMPSSRSGQAVASPFRSADKDMFAPPPPATSHPSLLGSNSRPSPFKSADSDMFAPPPPSNQSNTLRNLLLSPLKRPGSGYRPNVKSVN